MSENNTSEYIVFRIKEPDVVVVKETDGQPFMEYALILAPNTEEVLGVYHHLHNAIFVAMMDVYENGGEMAIHKDITANNISLTITIDGKTKTIAELENSLEPVAKPDEQPGI